MPQDERPDSRMFPCALLHRHSVDLARIQTCQLMTSDTLHVPTRALWAFERSGPFRDENGLAAWFGRVAFPASRRSATARLSSLESTWELMRIQRPIAKPRGNSVKVNASRLPPSRIGKKAGIGTGRRTRRTALGKRSVPR